MSKQRPSRTSLRPQPASGQRGPAKFQVHYWRSRLFKNTFTRNGRRKHLRPWSVKIQHQGRRKTFSLASTDRQRAANEAYRLFKSILLEGWEALPRSVPTPAAATQSKNLIRYWKQRLLERPYYDPVAPVAANGFSARIEREGIGCYFPLGSRDPERAAAKALQIFRVVTNKGWEPAFASFSREVALAIHWAANPVAWTYTTFHTQLTDSGANRASAAAAAAAVGADLSVILIEPDEAIRHALAFYINRHPGFRCEIACPNAASAFAALCKYQPRLALVNHHLPDMEGPNCLERLQNLLPGRPCLLFSIYEDSVQLFKSTPGGASGYFLKRTPPDKILQPFPIVRFNDTLSVRQVQLSVAQYFQKIFASLQASQPTPEEEKLTPRENQIMDYLSKGYLDKEIADTLGISVWTVHGHVKNIFEKLKVHTRTEAVVKCLLK